MVQTFPGRTKARIVYSIVRKDVAGRAGERCEIRSDVCEIRGTECHHLLPRSEGGKDEIANCVWTCDPCHRYLHENKEEAYSKNWLRRP